MKKQFIVNFWFFVSFMTLTKVFYVFWQISFHKIVKVAFSVFIRTPWWKKTSVKQFSFFISHCSETFSHFRQKNYGKFVRTVFYVFRKHFPEVDISDFFLVIVFNISNLSKIFSALCQIFFRNVVKAAFYKFRRTVWWKQIFLKAAFLWTLSKTFSDFVKFFCSVSKTAFNAFIRTLCWKTVFWKNLLQFFFRLWAKHFLTFGKITRQSLSKIFLPVQKTFWINRLFFFSMVFC